LKTVVPLSWAKALATTATTTTAAKKDNTKDDNAVFRNFFFAAILDLPFLTFFVGVTIEVDIFCPLEVLASGGVQFLIVFAMVG
jgi:hypothetical protein